MRHTDDEQSPPDQDPDLGEVPAGGAGADSGATDAVRIDGEDSASIANIGSQNDTPGVGARPPSRS